MHVPSSQYVHFKSFITAFNESYNSDWTSEPVYGRTDPIRMFKQTTRNITLGLIIPAASEGEGFENLGKLQDFLSFLYPSYEEADNALTISQSPLIRLRVMNMIRKTRYATSDPLEAASLNAAAAAGPNNFVGHKIGRHDGLHKNGANEGLLGNITSVAINHNLENLEAGSFVLADGVVIPKAIELTVDFQVIHEKVLGWTGDSFSDRLFPYGLDLSQTTVKTEQQIRAEQERLAQQAVKAEIERRTELEEEEKKEAMLQNAIAAGHLVASGVVDGEIQYEATGGAKRRKRTIVNQLNRSRTDKNPFNGKHYPEGAAGDAEIQADTQEFNFLSGFIK